MTRRDYKVIASAIDKTDKVYNVKFNDQRVRPSEVIDFLTDALSEVLSADNYKFDAKKFRAACVESRLKFYRDR